VDGRTVGRDGERARRIAEEGDDGERGPLCGEVVAVEHPDVGAADAWRGQLGIIGKTLAAVGGGDERARATRPGEHDVGRLVACLERARDAGTEVEFAAATLIQ